jgi:hypothetical protein
MLDDLRKLMSEAFTQTQLPLAHIHDRRIVLDESLEVVDAHQAFSWSHTNSRSHCAHVVRIKLHEVT